MENKLEGPGGNIPFDENANDVKDDVVGQTASASVDPPPTSNAPVRAPETSNTVEMEGAKSKPGLPTPSTQPIIASDIRDIIANRPPSSSRRAPVYVLVPIMPYVPGSCACNDGERSPEFITRYEPLSPPINADGQEIKKEPEECNATLDQNFSMEVPVVPSSSVNAASGSLLTNETASVPESRRDEPSTEGSPAMVIKVEPPSSPINTDKREIKIEPDELNGSLDQELSKNKTRERRNNANNGPVVPSTSVNSALDTLQANDATSVSQHRREEPSTELPPGVVIKVEPLSSPINTDNQEINTSVSQHRREELSKGLPPGVVIKVEPLSSPINTDNQEINTSVSQHRREELSKGLPPGVVIKVEPRSSPINTDNQEINTSVSQHRREEPSKGLPPGVVIKVEPLSSPINTDNQEINTSVSQHRREELSKGLPPGVVIKVEPRSSPVNTDNQEINTSVSQHRREELSKGLSPNIAIKVEPLSSPINTDDREIATGQEQLNSTLDQNLSLKVPVVPSTSVNTASGSSLANEAASELLIEPVPDVPPRTENTAVITENLAMNGQKNAQEMSSESTTSNTPTNKPENDPAESDNSKKSHTRKSSRSHSSPHSSSRTRSRKSTDGNHGSSSSKHRSSHSSHDHRDHRSNRSGRSSHKTHNFSTQADSEKILKEVSESAGISTTHQTSRIPWFPHPRLLTYRYYRYYRIETDCDGGGDVCHMYWDEICHLDQQTKEDIALEFIKLVYSEDEENCAYHVLGIVHDAASELPDLLDYGADHYPGLVVKTGSLTGPETSSTTMAEYRNEVYKTYSNGTFRHAPLQEISICGVKGEEVGAYFPDFVRRLEANPCIKPVMPWSKHTVVHTDNPRESNDGPIFWIRPGEQTIPTSESSRVKGRVGAARVTEAREVLFEDRTNPHADHIGIDGITINTAPTAAVGVLKAVVCGEKDQTQRATKDVIAFNAGDYNELVQLLHIDLYEPPLKQCPTWIGTGKLNSLRRLGIRYAHVKIGGDAVYYLPRKVIHQFQTTSAVASVAWHVRWKDYFSKRGAPNLHKPTGYNKGPVYYEKKEVPVYVPPVVKIKACGVLNKGSPAKRYEKSTTKISRSNAKKHSSTTEIGSLENPPKKVKKSGNAPEFADSSKKGVSLSKPSTSGMSTASDSKGSGKTKASVASTSQRKTSVESGTSKEQKTGTSERRRSDRRRSADDLAAKRPVKRRSSLQSSNVSSPTKTTEDGLKIRTEKKATAKPLRENIPTKRRRKVAVVEKNSGDLVANIMREMDKQKMCKT